MRGLPAAARPAPAPDGQTITKRETRIQKERDVDLREVSGFQLKGRLTYYLEVHVRVHLVEVVEDVFGGTDRLCSKQVTVNLLLSRLK